MLAPLLIATTRLSRQPLPGDVLLQSRNGQRAGRLHDGARVLEHVLDGGADLVCIEQHDLIDMVTAERERFFAHAPDRNAVGENSDPVQGDPSPGLQRLVHAGGVLRLHSDDADVGIEVLDVHRDPRDEAAAANGDEDRIHIAARLPQQLHPDRTLARDDIRVVERMHEHQAAFPCELQRPIERRVVVVSMQHDFAAEIDDRLHLDLRGGTRHHDRRGDAPPPCRECDALRMITR